MRLSEDARRDTPLTTSGAGEPPIPSKGINGDTTGRTTTTSNGNINEITTPGQETRRDITENTTGTTTPATEAANTTTTAPSTADEPAPPPKAVLPPSSG
ncbi:hypothetical protein RRF57_007940 [Xylaria bambusicola]|uniref:Uncharacterized protein n=1 Tax=Xylaria bambusicola TaxID=326684 RepID=A0AAN7ZAQ4_9PEZI